MNGAGLAASLVRFDWVNEFRLYLMPVVLGGGKQYFEVGLRLKLEPLGVESWPQQCTLLRFRPEAVLTRGEVRWSGRSPLWVSSVVAVPMTRHAAR